MDNGPLLDSLRAAVARQPDDVALRAHLAALLLQAGAGQEAVAHVALLLAGDPGNAEYLRLMSAAVAAAAQGPGEARTEPPGVTSPGSGPAGAVGSADGFDWGAAEQDLAAGLSHDPVETRLRLADVGGLQEVKDQFEAAFLTPLRNPELRARYGATLRGGMLLYGPPGCGKTHVARAVAGELGARFIAVSLADVLSRWMGESEANVADLFRYARAQAPCVLFLDEVDALGRARSALGRSGAAMRGIVNQILTELDGVASANEGVYVLAATNAPWDVDLALRRPGRLDRSVLVAPPDEAARAEILSTHLQGLPVAADLDLTVVARSTEGFSGADLALVCRTAAQAALADAVRAGGAERDIDASDLERAARGIQPSTGRWFQSARNVVLFADESGEFSELDRYMRARGML